jgi:transposase
MRSHPNAHLNQKGRLRLVTEHLEHGLSLKELAAENGISLRCASRWLARYRSGGPASLTDRRSVRRSQRRTLDPQQLQQAVDHRHQRCTLRRIAKALKAPLATVGRVMNALRLGRLRNLKPRKPVQRYQWERPGDMIHVDTKQLARFERVGSSDVESGHGGSSPWRCFPSSAIQPGWGTPCTSPVVFASMRRGPAPTP